VGGEGEEPKKKLLEEKVWESGFPKRNHGRTFPQRPWGAVKKKKISYEWVRLEDRGAVLYWASLRGQEGPEISNTFHNSKRRGKGGKKFGYVARAILLF